MELDLYCTTPHPARIGEIARQARVAGFAGLWVTEAAHNPWIACALAAEAAEGLMVGTDVAIAFPRSPMVTAQAADPPIYLAGVNERLATVTGEVADGFCAHPLNSPQYLNEVVRPGIEEGAKQAGRDPSSVAVVCPVFTIVGGPGPALDRQRENIRLQIAFYGT